MGSGRTGALHVLVIKFEDSKGETFWKFNRNTRLRLVTQQVPIFPPPPTGAQALDDLVGQAVGLVALRGTWSGRRG